MTDDRITFYIVDPNEPSTKSSDDRQTIPLEVGGEKFDLTLTVEDNAAINTTPETRGAAYDNTTHLKRV